jgi:hypothetical protein
MQRSVEILGAVLLLGSAVAALGALMAWGATDDLTALGAAACSGALAWACAQLLDVEAGGSRG